MKRQEKEIRAYYDKPANKPLCFREIVAIFGWMTDETAVGLKGDFHFSTKDIVLRKV